MLVVDTNILIRAVLGRRVGLILSQHSVSGFVTPDLCVAEAQRHLPSLIAKRGRFADKVTLVSCF